jgi:hypothetical protein
MSFLPFQSNYVPGTRPNLVRQVTNLRRRLADQRQYDAIAAPTLCGTDAALALLQQSYPSSVCLISRPLCGLYEPALGGCPQRYGNVPFSVDGAGFGGSCGGGGGSCAFNYNYYGRGGAGGWQQIGYLLPLHVDGRVGGGGRGQGSGRRCTCSHGRNNNAAAAAAARQGGWQTSSGRVTPSQSRRNLQRPSQFGSAFDASEPYDSYNNAHEPGCPLFADDDYQNREYGARRYHLYVRVNPDRLGQQCVYTSARRGDHRYNNCRYLQFGVSEEGVQDSAILLLTSDYFVDNRGSNRAFNRAARCVEDGDVLFLPSEGRRKFRVNLYDDRVYDGNC